MDMPLETAPSPMGWREVDSPVGPLLLAATTTGLARVVFAEVEPEPDEISVCTSVECERLLDQVARQLAEYFDGRRRSFLLPLDRGEASGFRAQARACLEQIGYGQTISYSELAQRAGRPSAVRAAASACATNPLPIVVPCHRVLRADGHLGGYLGGVQAKAFLLDLEGTAE